MEESCFSSATALRRPPRKSFPVCPSSAHRIELLFIQPGKPIQNGHFVSLNGRLRDKCLNQHWFLSIRDAQFHRSVGGGATTPVDRTKPRTP